MQKRYVLVSNPKKLTLNNEWLSKYDPIETIWLSEGKACEIVTKQTITLEEDVPVDLFEFGPQETNRKKKYLFCDMDATILDGESLDEMTNNLPNEIQEKISSMTLETMYGKVNLEQSIRQRVSYLKDQPVSVIGDAIHNTPLMPGAKTLVATMKKHGAYCTLISSGFTHITRATAERVGFDEDHANQLEVKDDTLTGIVCGNIVDGEEKGRITKRTLQRFGTNAHNALAIGDGSNDVYMLSETEMGIAYYAKPILKQKSKHQINHTDLVSALYAQGYKDEEIIFL